MSTILLKTILPAWKPGPAIGHRNLTLVPLSGGGHQPRFQDYLLASEAIDAGVLTVTEVSESGSVPELLAVNDGDRPILLIDGEELQGAKQNRILNTSVLLPPNSKTRIPVSCVEEGRWHHVSPIFKSGNYAPSSLRQRKSRDVHASLRTRGRAESDQGAVWESVADQIVAHCPASPTRAMSDAISTMGDTIAHYQDSLPYPSGACGVVAAVCGQFVAMDAFDSPSTLAAIWGRLVASYAMDAETTPEKPPKAFTANAAGFIVEQVAEQSYEAFNAVGLGQDLRFEADDVLGQGLETDGHLMHLCVFPPMAERRRSTHADPRMTPPSRRHRTDK